MSKSKDKPDSDELLVAALMARQGAVTRFRELFQHGNLPDEHRRQVDDCVNKLAAIAAGLSRPADLAVLQSMHRMLDRIAARRERTVEAVARALKRDDKAEAAGNLRAELTWWIDPAFEALNLEWVSDLLANPGRRRAARIAAALSAKVNAFGDRSEGQAFDAFKAAVRELTK